MVTKLHAADIARRAGVMVYIAKGSERDAILRIARKETVGTCFLPMLNKLESRKRYLLAGATAEGSISVDAGAARALARGGSLLPVGVTAVAGDFDRGDTVQILNPGGKMIALGLCNYAARDLAHFSGHQSQEIESLVGFTFGDEVVHRNNMILMRQDG
jgi:glutamate 5-kinase